MAAIGEPQKIHEIIPAEEPVPTPVPSMPVPERVEVPA